MSTPSNDTPPPITHKPPPIKLDRYRDADFRDNSDRAAFLVKAFWAILIVDVFTVIAEFMLLNQLQQPRTYNGFGIYERTPLEEAQNVVGIASFLQICVFIVTAIAFISWLRRAYGNLHRLGTPFLHYGEAAAVWSFFVPLFNWVAPFQIVQDVVRGTQQEIQKLMSWYKGNTSMILVSCWWGAYVINGVLGVLLLRMMNRHTMEGVLFGVKLTIGVEIFGMIAAALAIAVVKNISEEENTLYRQIKKAKDNFYYR